MDSSVERLIEAASEYAGGDDQLADYLNITPMLLRAYRDGRRPMPDFLFLRTVDFLLAKSESGMGIEAAEQKPDQGAKPQAA